MRRAKAAKRKVQPDRKYGNVTVTRFINLIMERGKKSTAEKIVYDAIDELEAKTKMKGLEAFMLALDNVGPALEIKARRVGGANYQIPYEVRGDRKYTLAMRWIIEAAKGKKGKPMSKRLAKELRDAINKEGSAMKKREDVHRMAEANKAFAHFAW